MNYVIINGGDSLPGAPESWGAAHAWEEIVNADGFDYKPEWRFDCGFKLDYDGPLIHVSSRFYPPAQFYGPTWDGSVKIIMGDDILDTREFDCKTLDELRTQVEAYVKSVRERITLKPIS